MLLRAVPWRISVRQAIMTLTLAMLAALFAAWTVGPGTTRAGAGNGVNIAGHYIPIDPAGFLYVTNNTQTTNGVTTDGTTVDIFNESNNSLVKTLTVGHAPKGIARVDYSNFDTTSTHIFVANSADGTVSMISDSSDPSTDTVAATIPVGAGPWGLAADPANHAVVVVNNASNSIAVIDGVSGSVLANLSLPLSGGSPEFVTIDNASHKAYVADPANGVVYSINISNPSAPTVNGWLSFTCYTHNVAADQLGHVFVACNRGGNSYGTINVEDTATDTYGTGSAYAAYTGDNLFGIAVNPVTHEIDATSLQNNSLYRYTYDNSIGFQAVAGQPVQLSSDPKGITFTDDGTKAYVAHQATGTMDQVNPSGTVVPFDDRNPPVTSLAVAGPYHGGEVLNGTATDDFSGVDEVQAVVNGSSTAPAGPGTSLPLTCSGADRLNCTFHVNVPTAEGQYYVWLRGIDRNTGVSGRNYEAWHSVRVIVDTGPPVSHITSPGSPSILIGGLSKVSGTAADTGSGVASVRLIFIQKVTLKTYTVPTTLSCNATAQSCTWTTTVPLDINLGLYKVYSSATDYAGNVEAPNLGLILQVGLLTP